MQTQDHTPLAPSPQHPLTLSRIPLKQLYTGHLLLPEDCRKVERLVMASFLLRSTCAPPAGPLPPIVRVFADVTDEDKTAVGLQVLEGRLKHGAPHMLHHEVHSLVWESGLGFGVWGLGSGVWALEFGT
jgi:hypothetical protein